MCATIELTWGGIDGSLLSFFCLLTLLAVGATLQNGDSDSNSSSESDSDFLESAEFFLNDILRYLLRRHPRGDDEETRADASERVGRLDEVETIFDDLDEPDDVDDFSSDFETEDEDSDDVDAVDDDARPAEDRSNFAGAFFKNRKKSDEFFESQDSNSDDGETARDDSFADDDSLPLNQRIARLRKRLQDGDESARLELIAALVESTTNAKAYEKERVFRTLDEARSLVEQSDSAFDDDYEEAACQIALQRPVFYMRNEMKPPFELVAAALRRVQEWREKSDTEASRQLLARAWLLHGQRLLASGSSSAALASFKKARRFFESSLTSYVDPDKKFPSLGFVLVAEADAYRMAGDFDKAIVAYKEAAEVFDAFRSKRVFLAQRANVLCQLSLTLRSIERFKEAGRVMNDAIAAEERLYSYDSNKYGAGLAQLLRVQADTSLKLGDVDSSFALMDRAESVLLSSLQVNAPLKRRAFAFMQLVHVLRGRAGMNFMRRKSDLARRDALNALRYLSLAAEKDDDLNPGPTVVAIFALVYDMATASRRWDDAERLNLLVKKTLLHLSPRERRVVDPMYAELLLHMHMVNASEKRFDDAIKATNQAVKLLDRARDEEDRAEANRREFLLIKALYQRGSYAYVVENNLKSALADFERIDSLFRETDVLDDDENARQTRAFYIEFSWRLAGARWRAKDARGAGVAAVDACRMFYRAIEAGDWFALGSLKRLVCATLFFAEHAEQPTLFLRTARFWIKFIQATRRKFLEVGWRVEDSFEEQQSNNEALEEFEEALLSVFMARVRFVGKLDWKPEYKRYFDAEKVFALVGGRSDLPPMFGAPRSLTEACRCVGLSPEDLRRERKEFVCERLGARPKETVLWFDLQRAASAAELQVASGNLDQTRLLVGAVGLLRLLYRRFGELRLEATETSLAAGVVSLVAARKDKTFPLPRRVNPETFRDSDASDGASSSAAISDLSAQTKTDGDDESNDEANGGFWTGAFFISHFYIESLERLWLKGKTDFRIDIDPFQEMRDDNEVSVWLRSRSGEEESNSGDNSRTIEITYSNEDSFSVRETSSSESVDSGDGENPDETETRGDADDDEKNEELNAFADLAEKKNEQLDQAFEIARFFGRKAVVEEPWRYFQHFVFVKHCFERLEKLGRDAEAKTMVSEETKPLKSLFDVNPFVVGFLVLCYNTIADIALRERRDLSYSKELLLEMVKLKDKISPLAVAMLPKTLYGNVYARLARIAEAEGDEAGESAFLRDAGEAFVQGIQGDHFDEDCFVETTKYLKRLLSSDDEQDEKRARSILRIFADAFDAQFESLVKRRRENEASASSVLMLAWIVFMQGGSYYDVKRRCFSMADRLFRRADKILEILSARGALTLPFDVYRIQMELIAFYGRYGFVKDGVRTLLSTLRSCRRLLAAPEKYLLDKETIGNINRAVLELNIIQADYAIFNGASGTSTASIVETVEKIRELPEFISFSSSREKRGGRLATKKLPPEREDDSEKTSNISFWGYNYFIAREFRALANYQDAGFTQLEREIKSLIKEARRSFGTESRCERFLLGNWADFALCRGKWSSAARAAARLRRRSKRDAFRSDDDSSYKMLALNALKTEAAARLERKGFGDLRKAEKLVDAAFLKSRKMFAERLFQVRTIYAELLILRAEIGVRRKRLELALADARRAKKIVEQCERKGITGWVPAIRCKLKPLLESLESRSSSEAAASTRKE